jgi:hypothetical protein
MRKGYSKNDLERLVMTQLENLNAQGEYIRLIKEQNELLLKYNQKLKDELSDKLEEPKPYPIQKRKKLIHNDDVGGAVS